MKIIQPIVFACFFLISVVASAEAIPFSEGPAPLQSYQSAVTSNKHHPEDASQLAKVRAIMAKAKRTVQAGKVRPLSANDAVRPASVSAARSINRRVSESAHELQSQINQLNQATLRYQQLTNQHIEVLRSQNKVLQAKLRHLTQAMLLMNAQLVSMKSSLKSQSSAPQATNLSRVFQYVCFGIVTLLTVMLGFLISCRRNKSV